MSLEDVPAARKPASAAEVFRVALTLGLTSFGGPVAHLGYFARTYVQERRWLAEAEYTSLIGLCQLLPGPTSSQVGFLVGYRRAGWPGALAAWLGFTLPSALLMYAFALFATRADGPAMRALVHGLVLSAVAVVAQAVWSMARSLCPDVRRAAIAVVAAALLLLQESAAMQLTAMLVGAIGGALLSRGVRLPKLAPPAGVRLASAWSMIGICGGLALALPLLAGRDPHGTLAFTSIVYRAGALVFGGGHVVLPLLRDALVPGWVSDGIFLTGYGFAQGIPGPLFAFAAYLGAVSAPAHSAAWAVLALVAIFLPGLLLASAALSLWSRLAQVPAAPAMLAGINAAVVGILAAALYDPVCTTGIKSGGDAVVALAGWVLLQRWRVPPVLVVAVCIVASVAFAAATGRL